jgi:hypothetical protein
MNARELSKKWRAERLAWEEGAEIEGRAAVSFWLVYVNPYWDSPHYEWRVKPERYGPTHYRQGAEPFPCGINSGEFSSDWSQVTCSACRAKRPGEPITAASEPTSREDLLRQRNWAVDEAKKLWADCRAQLTACESELEAMQKQFPTTREQTNPTPRPPPFDPPLIVPCGPPKPPLPDMAVVRDCMGSDMQFTGNHALLKAMEQIVKHLTS